MEESKENSTIEDLQSRNELCCPCSKYQAQCIRNCPCVLNDRKCTCCQPSMMNRCQNLTVELNVESNILEGSDNVGDSADDFANKKFLQAFGARMVREDGDDNDEFRKMYLEMVELSGRQYSLPDGNVGKRFVNLLAAEIEKRNNGLQNSEVELLFTSLILQRKRLIN